MALDTGSIPTLNQRFKNWRNRLFFIYFVVITGILSSSSIFIYSLIVYYRYAQVDDHLREVGTWSASVLEILLHEYEELQKYPKYKGYVPENSSGSLTPITISQLMGKYYFDSLYQIIPNPPSYFSQSVQWYDKDGHLIIYEGKKFSKIKLPDNITESGIITETDAYRYLIIPVYKNTHQQNKTQIIGYVCVIESLTALEEELNYLRFVFFINILGISAVTLLAASWLTHQSIRPVITSLNQLKSFTADASHQLRHPITAIQASISMLEENSKNLDSLQLNKIKVISSACYQMGSLINKLLLLARMDHNRVDQSRWLNVDMDELLEALVDLHRDRAESKGITLSYICENNGQIYADPEQIYEIFSNLLDNALHYTPSNGSITVRLVTKGSCIIVQVQDTGMGISSVDIPHIFNRFWRSPEARMCNQQGSGLGLSVVKMLVEHYRGTITVHSQWHQGTCFEVRLPSTSAGWLQSSKYSSSLPDIFTFS